MHCNCKKGKFVREKGCKYKEKQYTEKTAELSNTVAPFRLTFLKISEKNSWSLYFYAGLCFFSSVCRKISAHKEMEINKKSIHLNDTDYICKPIQNG